MSLDNEEAKDASMPVLLDPQAYVATSKLYSHQEIVMQSTHEVQVLFGMKSPFLSEEEGESLFITNSVICMTIPHFEEFVGTVNRHLETLKEKRK